MAIIDLRSDTVTKPTKEMYEAMVSAPVGDDVLGDDPTVKKLEHKAAEMMGKEAAMFVASGTMGNLIAVLTHTSPGDEIILEADAHIYWYEVGGLAAFGGVMTRRVLGKLGVISPDDIADAVRPPNIHFPSTTLLCLENTHNRAGGTYWTAKQTEAACQAAKRHGLRVHLDGARIFNAAVAQEISVKELVAPVDSVMFCLSKGLSAPVGSLLVGTAEFIAQARKVRKRLGGGMRQAGVLAACGLVALDSMVDRLSEDHRRARMLAEGIHGLPGLGLDLATVQTNMVRFDVSKLGVTAALFVKMLEKQGVLANVADKTKVRLVTNRHIKEQHVSQTVAAIEQITCGLTQD